MKRLLVSSLLILFIGIFISGVSLAEGVPLELEVPDYYNDGKYCPDSDSERGIAILSAYAGTWGVTNFDPLTRIFLCGRVYSVQPDDPLLIADGFKKAGDPIKGVFIATYEELLSGELRKPNVQAFTNGEGEFMVPVKKSKAVTYLGVFCMSEDGQRKYLVDLFKVQNLAKSEAVFDIGVPCREFQATAEIARAAFAPEPLGYIDEEGFLQCGVDRVTGGFEGTNSDKTANFSHYVTEEVGYYNGNTFTLEDVDENDVPPELTILTPEEIEGRHGAEYFSDEVRGTLAADQLFNPGYTAQRVVKQDAGQNVPLPLCSTLLPAYQLVSTSGDRDFNYGNTAGFAAGMSFPGQIEALFDLIPSDVKNTTDVCINTSGNTRKLSSFQYGDADFPYQKVLEISGNMDLTKNLATNRQKYLGTSDSGYNYGDGAGEYCRQAFASGEEIANTPFKACADIVKPYVNEVDYLLGPSVNAANNFAFPGSTLLAQAVGGGTAATIQRIGIGSKHCTCSTLEGGECNYPEPAYGLEGHPTSSGYKVTTEQVANPNTFYGYSLSGALANIFLNVTAQFQVALENLESAINNENQCVPVTGEQQVSSCQGVDDCHQVCDPPGSTNCTYYVNEYTYSCNGSVGVAINTETVIQGTSGDSIGYSTQALKNMFRTPYLTRNAVGGIALPQSTLTNGGSNTQELNYGLEGPVQATYNTDHLRFAKRFPENGEEEDLLPIMVYPSTEEEISSVCSPDSFAELLSRGTLPEPYSYSGSVPIPPYVQATTGPDPATAYAYAEEKTGVPCLVLAGIHFREAGNDPLLDLQQGADTNGTQEALNSSAEAAALDLEANIGKDGKDWTPQDLIKAVMLFNGPGNSQCQWQGYDPVLTTYTSCPPLYEGEDNLYVMRDFAPKYVNMSLIYPADNTRADLFCADESNSGHDLWNQCPTPIEYPGNPGAFTASMYFFQLLGGDPNGN